MNLKKTSSIFLLLIASIFILISSSCTDKYKPSSAAFTAIEESSCTQCHLNSTLLKEVATPLPPKDGEAGEG